jgi:hypothetical protein
MPRVDGDPILSLTDPRDVDVSKWADRTLDLEPRSVQRERLAGTGPCELETNAVP